MCVFLCFFVVVFIIYLLPPPVATRSCNYTSGGRSRVWFLSNFIKMVKNRSFLEKIWLPLSKNGLYSVFSHVFSPFDFVFQVCAPRRDQLSTLPRARAHANRSRHARTSTWQEFDVSSPVFCVLVVGARLELCFFFVCLFATPAACRSLTFALRSEEKFWNKTPFVNHSLLNVEFLIIFPIFLLFDLFSLLFLVSFGIFVSFFVFSVLFVKFTYASCGLLRVSVFFLSVLHDAAMIVSHYAQFSTFSFPPLVCVFSFYNNFYV